MLAMLQSMLTRGNATEHASAHERQMYLHEMLVWCMVYSFELAVYRSYKKEHKQSVPHKPTCMHSFPFPWVSSIFPFAIHSLLFSQFCLCVLATVSSLRSTPDQIASYTSNMLVL